MSSITANPGLSARWSPINYSGSSLRGLNAKYRIKYERLRAALEAYAHLQLENNHNFYRLCEFAGELTVPGDLYANQLDLDDALSDSGSELDSAIWFVSVLTRIDGLALMNPLLEVLGFGVEIKYKTEPEAVVLAFDPMATKRNLLKGDYKRYGTRHLSMMRYCASVPGSVGFVVSQDGDVRVITKVEEGVAI